MSSIVSAVAARLPEPVRARVRGLVRGAPPLALPPEQRPSAERANTGAASPTDEAMTMADVHAAYRLFVGRPADPQGLDFFAPHVGSWSVRQLLPYFAHSDEFRSSDTYRLLLGGVHGSEMSVVDRGDYQVVVPDGDGAIGEVLKRTGTYEPHVLKALDEALKPSMTGIDCGANIGIISMHAASLVGPTGRVIALEAIDTNTRLIHLSAAMNHFAHVEVRHAAVAAEPGVLVVDTASGSNGIVGGRLSDLIGHVDPETLALRTIVGTVTLDSLLATIDHADLIKLDIEGAEGLAIAGAMQLLERDHPTILLEFSPDLLRQVSGIDGTSLLSTLAELGYQIDILDGPNGAEINVDLDRPAALMAGSGRDHLDLRLAHLGAH